MKLETPGLFVNGDAKNLRETDVEIRFGSPFMSRCLSVSHRYSDNSEIHIFVYNGGLRITFDYNYIHYDIETIRELTWDSPKNIYNEYNGGCDGRCGGCSEMHVCHDLG